MTKAWRRPPTEKPFILNLYPPVLIGDATPVNIANNVTKWARSIRLRGGFWMGSFEVRGSIDTLEAWIYDLLGHHVVESVGRTITWEGMVYEVDLIRNGIRRRRSLDQMSNYVITSYTNASGEQGETSAQSNPQSIARFGRKEARIAATNMPASAANAYGLTVLRESAWAQPKTIGLSEAASDSYAKVTVCGYVFTANWRYASATTLNGETTALNAIISSALTNDCEFLRAGRIASNAITAARATRSPMRAWEFIDRIARMGDGSGNPWRAFVNQDRRLNFEMIDQNPSLYLRDGNIYSNPGLSTRVNPYAITPGIARDTTVIGRRRFSDSIRDARDILIEEVEVNAEGNLVLKTGSESESEMIAAQYRGL